MDNAVAYSPGDTRVAVGRPRRGRRFAEIAVTDQGIGIPESDRTRVFERFYRVDQARSRATGGTGLGLAIVKHVATNHGGAVTRLERGGLRLHLHAAPPAGRPAPRRAATPARCVAVAPPERSAR